MAKKESKEKKQKKHYFKDMKAELKKVVWPTPKQLANNVTAVIVYVLIIGLIVFALDVCFEMLNTYGITPLQEKIQSTFAEETEQENTENQDADNVSEEEATDIEGEAVEETTNVEGETTETNVNEENTVVENNEAENANTENQTDTTNE